MIRGAEAPAAFDPYEHSNITVYVYHYQKKAGGFRGLPAKQLGETGSNSHETAKKSVRKPFGTKKLLDDFCGGAHYYM